MKVLLDTCVWGGAVDEVRHAGHDVVWSGDWPEDPGDEEILSRAHSGGRVLVTLDKDFGELAVVHGHPHSGIVRLVGFAARLQGPMCVAALDKYRDDLESGALVIVEPNKVRVRPANRSGDD
jgi:predicted nuclease of predicted toxin-antitoxin system